MVSKQVRKAVIPAAGLGTRFLPATKASPKEMLSLVDKPLIQYVVEEAVASGIHQIIIITGRGKRAIEDHFDIAFELEETLKLRDKHALLGDLRKISDMADFCYIRQRQPLGLGHALLCAKNVIGDEPFAVLLGDEIIDHPTPALKQMIDIYDCHAVPLVGVQRVSREVISQYGVIDIKPTQEDNLFEIKDLVEKPLASHAPSDLAIVGRYILDPKIFDVLEKTAPGKHQEIQLTDALRELVRQRTPMFAYLLSGNRFDAGDKVGFLKATVELALRNKEVGASFRKYLQELEL